MAAPVRRKAQSRHQLRKDMPAVGSKQQWLDPKDIIERQFAIEMRKQCPLARGLPSERRAETAGVDRNQDQVGRSRKMLGRGLLDLAGAGEMDVAITRVDTGAAELAGGFGVLPQRRIADLVDDVRHGPRPRRCLGCAAPEPRRTGMPSTPMRGRESPAAL